MDKMTEAFERFAGREGYDLRRMGFPRTECPYYYPLTVWAWGAWREAYEAGRREAELNDQTD